MNNPTRKLRLLPMAIATAVALSSAPTSWADDDEIPFAEAHLFFELNNTDGDLGIHAKIDGDPWKKLQIEGPDERKLLNIRVKSRLRRQGLTEIFFESAEPTFDELDPLDFFARFPAGEYEIEGKTLDGVEMESETELTHAMPAPAAVRVNGMPMAVQCDDEEPGYDATDASGSDGVLISWDAVTHSHPDAAGAGAGVQPPVPVTIHNYEVVVEADTELPSGEEFTAVMHMVLPATVRAVAVPEELLALTDTFKYEVLAREASYNQTAVESCFEIADE